MYCATSTPGMTCGLSNGAIIDPVALNEDGSETSPVSSPGDCYQRCLANPSCKSCFTSQWINATAGTAISSVMPNSNLTACTSSLEEIKLHLFSWRRHDDGMSVRANFCAGGIKKFRVSKNRNWNPRNIIIWLRCSRDLRRGYFGSDCRWWR